MNKAKDMFDLLLHHSPDLRATTIIYPIIG